MHDYEFYQVDAFAEKCFEGNPAAVVMLPERLTDAAWAQRVAAEMNLSETAFVDPVNDEGVRGLRWFTPEVEVALCGHATLAAAHALWTGSGAESATEIRFSTQSGELKATRVQGRAGQDLIELDFPQRPPKACEPPQELIEALGLMPRWVGLSGEDDYLIEVDSADTVAGLEPDFALLARVKARGVIVTARIEQVETAPTDRAGNAASVVSRFFGPAVGVDEDPVTGSAHCALAPYWAPRLKSDAFLAFQASPRGGFVGVELRGDRVALRGAAVTVVEGRLRG